MTTKPNVTVEDVATAASSMIDELLMRIEQLVELRLLADGTLDKSRTAGADIKIWLDSLSAEA